MGRGNVSGDATIIKNRGVAKTAQREGDYSAFERAELEGKKGLGATLCISSQVGCKMGYFCATGTMRTREFNDREIVEQAAHADDRRSR